MFLGFPCGSAGKESARNVGDLGSSPCLLRAPRTCIGRLPLTAMGRTNWEGEHGRQWRSGLSQKSNYCYWNLRVDYANLLESLKTIKIQRLMKENEEKKSSITTGSWLRWLKGQGGKQQGMRRKAQKALLKEGHRKQNLEKTAEEWVRADEGKQAKNPRKGEEWRV